MASLGILGLAWSMGSLLPENISVLRELDQESAGVAHEADLAVAQLGASALRNGRAARCFDRGDSGIDIAHLKADRRSAGIRNARRVWLAVQALEFHEPPRQRRTRNRHLRRQNLGAGGSQIGVEIRSRGVG